MANLFPEHLAGLTLYEVNIRQFTPSGTFKAFREHLPRLKELGIGIIWLMPVQPIGLKKRKGTLGSYYSIRDYCAVNEEFGTLQEFKELVSEIHAQGMYVLLDWVANHTSWDNRWVGEHPGYYRQNERGDVFPPFPDWEDVIGLDYSNPDTCRAMIDAMLFWLKETAIDGFRCDMAHLVPTYFWEQARVELEKQNPDLFMLAETDQYDLLDHVFQALYDWKLFHAMNEVAHHKISLYDFQNQLKNQLDHFPKTAALMRFISNHDENSWQGSELERLAYALEPFAVLYFMLPGIPLIYSGQEAGNYKRLRFFDKDEIDWKPDKMFPLYQKLIELKKTNPALWSSLYGGTCQTEVLENGKSFLVYRNRDAHSVLSICNFSGEKLKISINNPLYYGDWENILSGERERIFGNSSFEIAPYRFVVFQK